MLSFYQKLAMKLNDNGASMPAQPQAPAKAVSYNASGARTTPKDAAAVQASPAAAAAAVENEPIPDGADPLGVDLFQSESRMVIFIQAAGVTLPEFEITVDEEANTLVLQATQKRPDLPPAPPLKEGEPPEKGRYVKQEVKWATLYRKIYLPAPFDSGATEAVLNKGVLVILLPAKKPGVGRKLMVREIVDAKNENSPKV